MTADLNKQEELCKSAPPQAAVSLDLCSNLSKVTRAPWPYALIVCWAVDAKPQSPSAGTTLVVLKGAHDQIEPLNRVFVCREKDAGGGGGGEKEGRTFKIANQPLQECVLLLSTITSMVESLSALSTSVLPRSHVEVIHMRLSPSSSSRFSTGVS